MSRNIEGSAVESPFGTIDPHILLPLVSAGDLDQVNYTRVEFDEHIAWWLKDYAGQRAPNSRSEFNHLTGLAGELAVAAWQQEPVNRKLTADYEGDRGYDLEVTLPRHNSTIRLEVKTTRDRDSPEAVIEESKVDKADVFVLCATDAPTRRVDIIGYTSRPFVERFGDVYGTDGYLLSPEYMHIPEPIRISPDRVRDSQY